VTSVGPVTHAEVALHSGTFAVDTSKPPKKRSPTTMAGVAIVLGFVLVSAAVRVFGIGHPDALSLGSTLQAPTVAHPFGTDDLGRDVLVRTLYAGGTDIGFGALAMTLSVAIGTIVGVAAGSLGRWADGVLMRVVDFVLAFPLMVLVMAILVLFRPGLSGVLVAATFKGWPVYARLVRSEMLSLRDRPFVVAARMLGFSRRRVVGRHMLPHVVRSSLVYAPSDMLTTIALLASLSYLGLGVQPPTPEWGAIIAAGQPYLLNAWWIATLPGLTMVFFGLGLSLLGEGLAESMRVWLGGAR
jgi:peptide/nickel transport system permease protein